MFHGGTNFGFMNGCSAWGTTDLPQVTSYDYDASFTKKEIQHQIHLQWRRWWRLIIQSIRKEPLYKESMELEAIPLVEKVLFETRITGKSRRVSILRKWRSWAQLYLPIVQKLVGMQMKNVLIIDGRDRAQLCRWEVIILISTEIGEDIFIKEKERSNIYISLLKIWASTMDTNS